MIYLLSLLCNNTMLHRDLQPTGLPTVLVSPQQMNDRALVSQAMVKFLEKNYEGIMKAVVSFCLCKRVIARRGELSFSGTDR